MNSKSLDITRFDGNFKNIPSHELRKLIVHGRAHPEETSLVNFLSRGLWDIGRFKDLYALLPSVSLDSLRDTLELHAKVLFRLSLEEPSSLKKLLPFAFSMAHSVDSIKRNAMLGFLKTLVEGQDNESLTAYFGKFVELAKIDSEMRAKNRVRYVSEFFLSPDIASKVGLSHEFEQLQMDFSSEGIGSWYYLDGGHFILLAECQYFSEVDNRNRSILSNEINFLIDLARYTNGSAKEFFGKIRPHSEIIVKNIRLQGILAKRLVAWTCKTCTTKNQMLSFLDECSELNSFLAEICPKLPYNLVELRLVRIFALLHQGQARVVHSYQLKEAKNCYKLGLQEISKIHSVYLKDEEKLRVERAEQIANEGYVHLLCSLSDRKELSSWLNNAGQAARNKKLFIREVDLFLEDSESIGITEAVATALTMNEILLTMKSQKTRIQKTKKYVSDLLGRSE